MGKLNKPITAEEGLPVVAIVGRPNVGKSTLFNKWVGYRKAIVQDRPGITRDRNEAVCTYRDRQYRLIDTGGVLLFPKGEMEEAVQRQTEAAIKQADQILFIMSVKEGLLPDDQGVYRFLQKTGKPVFCVVNKMDGKGSDAINEYYRLGVASLYPISSENNDGLTDLLEALYPHFVPLVPKAATPVPRVVVLGRPNAGKSTLINALLREERLVTTDIPGTTRDTIDTDAMYNGKPYCFIDTAGIRKRGKVVSGVEQYSLLRMDEALDRADVALLILNAVEGVTEQDSKIAGLILKKGRGLILLVNKIDLLKEEEGWKERLCERITFKFSFLNAPEIEWISAKGRVPFNKIFKKIDALYERYYTRVTTGVLNQFFEKMITTHPPPLYHGRPVRLYYITQAGTGPPVFVIFVGSAQFPDHYLSYIENQLRAAFFLPGTPIKIEIRRKVKNTLR